MPGQQPAQPPPDPADTWTGPQTATVAPNPAASALNCDCPAAAIGPRRWDPLQAVLAVRALTTWVLPVGVHMHVRTEGREPLWDHSYAVCDRFDRLKQTSWTWLVWLRACLHLPACAAQHIHCLMGLLLSGNMQTTHVLHWAFKTRNVSRRHQRSDMLPFWTITRIHHGRMHVHVGLEKVPKCPNNCDQASRSSIRTSRPSAQRAHVLQQHPFELHTCSLTCSSPASRCLVGTRGPQQVHTQQQSPPRLAEASVVTAAAPSTSVPLNRQTIIRPCAWGL